MGLGIWRINLFLRNVDISNYNVKKLRCLFPIFIVVRKLMIVMNKIRVVELFAIVVLKVFKQSTILLCFKSLLFLKYKEFKGSFSTYKTFASLPKRFII